VSIRTWTCQYPVHHVVGKYKTIQCSVICATTIFAQRNVTRTLIKFSGKSINWLSLKVLRVDPVMRVLEPGVTGSAARIYCVRQSGQIFKSTIG
jgi:hypothetical protein